MKIFIRSTRIESSNLSRNLKMIYYYNFESYNRMTVVIEKRICIEQDKLDTNISKYILEKIQKMVKNECTKENGYILDVKRMIEIKDNYISNVNCDTIFVVTFEVETLKPEVGKHLEGEVFMVFGSGIFINVKNKQKILIPITTLKDYVFNSEEKCFIKGEKKIEIGDNLKVVVTGVKYTKHSFHCFGNMIEE